MSRLDVDDKGKWIKDKNQNKRWCLDLELRKPKTTIYLLHHKKDLFIDVFLTLPLNTFSQLLDGCLPSEQARPSR